MTEVVLICCVNKVGKLIGRFGECGERYSGRLQVTLKGCVKDVYM